MNELSNINNLKRILSVLRRSTTVVKIMPFAIVIGYVVAMMSQTSFDCDETYALDMIFYQFPINILFLLVLSICFKLCVWHKIECVLPILPAMTAMIDDHIIRFDALAAQANFITVAAMLAMSVINAYFMFIKPNTRRL